jgi:hypothetical protein
VDNNSSVYNSRVYNSRVDNSSVYNSSVDNSSVKNYILSSVWNKYAGNILPTKDDVLIRIGCEIHTIKEWNEHGASYARQDGEAAWWKESGQYILEFLKGEVERYRAKYLKAESK